MTNYRFGDIILVPFPFTNHAGTKQRPAVIVSSDLFQRRYSDVIIMPITSQIKSSVLELELLIEEWETAGLLKESIIKPVFMTLETNLIIKNLGKLVHKDDLNLKQLLKLIFI